jgi:hypothetical protein
MNRLLGAAIAIICLTNLGALTLGALNRSGTPDAEVTLTERELRLVRDRDSTATTLQLMFVQRFDAQGEWLTCPKLEALGVSCAPPPAGSDMGRWYASQPERRAYVVLEYDGPAWAAYRDAEQRRLQEMRRIDKAAAPNESDSLLDTYSRLVAIDADSDADTLRRRYSDTSRYVLVDARVSVYGRSAPDGKGAVRLSGTIGRLSPSAINVPKPYSSIFAGMSGSSYSLSAQRVPRYWVTVRYGRFHEPWVVNAGLSTR